MRIRVRHAYDFGPGRAAVGSTLLAPSAWDAARSLPGPFGLPETREEWEESAERGDLRERARDVVAVAREVGATRLCSHGVGTASLELNLHRLAPELQLVCTDYAPLTVERLRRLFPEAEVMLRDLTDPDPPPADLHLMHRLDAELDDDAWRSVLAAIDRPILFVPNVVLDLAGVGRELARRVLRRGSLTEAGWFRNEAALRALWSTSHRDRPLTISDSRAFLLEPR
jgi:hypothetical protein